MTVKRTAFAATLSLLLGFLTGSTAQAAAIDLGQPANVMRMGAAAAAPPVETAVLPVSISELPEPEVFAMMVVGLILIGYRASRDSSEKFK
jgi:hypothetical protein